MTRLRLLIGNDREIKVAETRDGREAVEPTKQLQPEVAIDWGEKKTARVARRKVLTNREIEVVRLVADGHSSKGIATALSISVKTAEAHRTNIMRTINCHNVVGLVRYAIRNHMIEA